VWLLLVCGLCRAPFVGARVAGGRGALPTPFLHHGAFESLEAMFEPGRDEGKSAEPGHSSIDSVVLTQPGRADSKPPKGAGRNTAMLASILATCVLHDVNPLEYLADVLIRVQDHPSAAIGDLVPHRWKQLFGQAAPEADAS